MPGQHLLRGAPARGGGCPSAPRWTANNACRKRLAALQRAKPFSGRSAFRVSGTHDGRTEHTRAKKFLEGESSRPQAILPPSRSPRKAFFGERRIAAPPSRPYIVHNESRTGWPISCTGPDRQSEEGRARRRQHGFRGTDPAQRETGGHDEKGRQRHGQCMHRKGERPARFILQSSACDFDARTHDESDNTGHDNRPWRVGS